MLKSKTNYSSSIRSCQSIPSWRTCSSTRPTEDFLFRSQPQRMNDPYFLEEHQRLEKTFRGWFTFEAKTMLEGLHKRKRRTSWIGEWGKRADGYAYMTTAFFSLPRLSQSQMVIAGATFDAEYLKEKFFPQMLDALIAYKLGEDGGNPLAMVVYAGDPDDAGAYGLAPGHANKPLAASAGWTEGKPEVSRNFADVFEGLTLGIKFQGTSVEALGRSWVQRGFLALGVLSLLLVGGLALTYRSVSKEVALARLKSDFVSNVSHELRTPLSLIRLYAETLELGRIKGQTEGGGVLPHHPQGERAAHRVDQQHPRLLAHRGRAEGVPTSDKPTLRSS